MKKVIFLLGIFVFGCATITPKIPVGFTLKQELGESKPSDEMTPQLLGCMMAEVDYDQSIEAIGAQHKESYVTDQSYVSKKGEAIRPRHDGRVQKEICWLTFELGDTSPSSSAKIRHRIKKGEYFVVTSEGNLLITGKENTLLPGDLWEMNALVGAWSVHKDERQEVVALAIPEDMQEGMKEGNWTKEVPIILHNPSQPGNRTLTHKSWFSSWHTSSTSLIIVAVRK